MINKTAIQCTCILNKIVCYRPTITPHHSAKSNVLNHLNITKKTIK